MCFTLLYNLTYHLTRLFIYSSIKKLRILILVGAGANALVGLLNILVGVLFEEETSFTTTAEIHFAIGGVLLANAILGVFSGLVKNHTTRITLVTIFAIVSLGFGAYETLESFVLLGTGIGFLWLIGSIYMLVVFCVSCGICNNRTVDGTDEQQRNMINNKT